MIINDKATRHEGLKEKNQKIILKTLEHELGHCFKSSFTNGYRAQLGYGREQDTVYTNLINNLMSYKNGKYASQIKMVRELNSRDESKAIKTGVHDATSNYKADRGIVYIDELLNETEALELADNHEIQEKRPLKDENGRNSASGNYVRVYNYMSRYSTFTGYGPILKSLLGKKETFYAEYISSKDIFKKFDEEYADVVRDVWGIDPNRLSAMECLMEDFKELLEEKFFDEQTMLKLDEFFAKCYEKKIEKMISQGNGMISQDMKDLTLNEMETFELRLTTNDDPKRRAELAHIAIFSKLKTKVYDLPVQKKQIESERVL